MGRRKGINVKIKNSIPPHSAQSAKKRKGGIREHNFMPVKSHEAHTFYGYESHNSETIPTLTPVRYMSKAIKIKVTFKVTST